MVAKPVRAMVLSPDDIAAIAQIMATTIHGVWSQEDSEISAKSTTGSSVRSTLSGREWERLQLPRQGGRDVLLEGHGHSALAPDADRATQMSGKLVPILMN